MQGSHDPIKQFKETMKKHKYVGVICNYEKLTYSEEFLYQMLSFQWVWDIMTW